MPRPSSSSLRRPAERALAAAPLPAIVEKIGVAVAKAQIEADRVAVEAVRLYADASEHGINLPDSDRKRSLIELGLTPTFLHFSEVRVHARVAFTTSRTSSRSASARALLVAGGGAPTPFGAAIAVTATTVSASYTNRFSYKADASGSVTTRIVSVPAPAVLSERLAGRRARGKE